MCAPVAQLPARDKGKEGRQRIERCIPIPAPRSTPKASPYQFLHSVLHCLLFLAGSVSKGRNRNLFPGERPRGSLHDMMRLAAVLGAVAAAAMICCAAVARNSRRSGAEPCRHQLRLPCLCCAGCCRLTPLSRRLGWAAARCSRMTSPGSAATRGTRTHPAPTPRARPTGTGTTAACTTRPTCRAIRPPRATVLGVGKPISSGASLLRSCADCRRCFFTPVTVYYFSLPVLKASAKTRLAISDTHGHMTGSILPSGMASNACQVCEAPQPFCETPQVHSSRVSSILFITAEGECLIVDVLERRLSFSGA